LGPGDEIVIEIEGLTKDYKISPFSTEGHNRRDSFLKTRTIRVLDHLSLAVRRGEIFGFLGPNGAGKTTTLKLLMGLVFPSGGSARILGQPIDDVETRARVGYLPENPYFYDHLSGRELLLYTAALFGIRGEMARQKANLLLTLVGLDDESADRQLRKYSKGMLQRIGIAQALVNDPEVLFLDEPMSGLDPVGRREVRDLLLSLRGEGKTIFFSSHIISDVEALCDRVAILNHGKLIKSGSIPEITGGQQSRIEVVVMNTDNSTLARLAAGSSVIRSINPIPNGAQLVIEDEGGLDEALSIIRQAGGKLISVNPGRTSLEDVFYK
jgi:ABC-2 type transport system ATP-binding protein